MAKKQKQNKVKDLSPKKDVKGGISNEPVYRTPGALKVQRQLRGTRAKGLIVPGGDPD